MLKKLDIIQIQGLVFDICLSNSKEFLPSLN